MDLILKNHGNYKELLTFKKATVIYDLTYHFANRFLSRGDRTVDQMIQAARSGKQNIAEGVAASSTNAETEIKLVNVAKASLKELLTDFEDYLRTRQLHQWTPGSKELEWVREKGRQELESAFWLDIANKRNDEVIANITIVLLKQEDYMLFKQLESLEKAFKERGDLRGRLHEESAAIRKRRFEAAEKAAMKIGFPSCPKCGKQMLKMAQAPEVKWRCLDCQTEQTMSVVEYFEVERSRMRALMDLRTTFPEFYRR